MEMKKGICFFFVFSLHFYVVVPVDRNNFKSCEQSAFCRRNRAIKPDNSQYVARIDSLEESSSKINLDIHHEVTNVVLNFEISFFEDQIFRFKINEKQPIKERFQVPFVVINERLKESRYSLTKDTNTIKIKFNDYTLTLFSKPFHIDVLKSDTLILQINGKGLMNFEHGRPKTTSKEEVKEEGNADEQSETHNNNQDDKTDEEGMWEESFKSHLDSKPHGPMSVGMDISFIGSNNVYGIPEHADSFSLKTTKDTDPYRLYNLDVFEYELYNPMALYGSVPVLVSHSKEVSVGIFWLNAAETWVDIDKSTDQGVVSSIYNLVSGDNSPPEVTSHWMSETGVIDVFIMLGPSGKDVVRQYAKITGPNPLPQMFTLGYHQCRWNYNDEDDVLTVDSKFDLYDIPYDVIWLDIEHTDGKKYFTWDKIKFPNPQDMINKLASKGRYMVTIVDPHIKRDGGYFLHNDALAQDLYVKNKDGSVYEGWCWPGSSSYLDFLNPTVCDYYRSQYLLDKYQGSTLSLYIWNDMNEPSVFNGPEVTMPKDCLHHGGVEHRDLHNMYGFLQHKSTFEGLVERSDGKLRPFILTRAHFAGTQRYAAVWTGDNTANWDHLKIVVPMLLSLSITGITFCGADVGGFFQNPDSELFVRWYQAGAFQPFFRAHSEIKTKRREPWLVEEKYMLHIKDAIRRRYVYLPLWYTLFFENELSGLPPMRPLWMEYPQDENTFGMDDEYMIGDSLLVHPVTSSGSTSVNVYLPGKSELWFDVETFQKFQGGQQLSLPVTLDKIPVFQRGGTIIPQKFRIRRASSLSFKDPYTYVAAINIKGQASGKLYIDDFESFNYRRGQYHLVEFTLENDILENKVIHQDDNVSTSSWLERVVLVNPSKMYRKATLLLPDGVERELEISCSENPKACVVRKPGVSVSATWSIRLGS